MKMFNKFAVIALAGGMSLGAAQTVSATTILVFGQNNSGSTVGVTGTQVGGTTTLTSTDVGVTLTTLENSGPAFAFFSFNAANTGVATVNGSNVQQNFAGTFSFFSGAGMTGTNFLSGNFTDLAVGGGASLTLTGSTPADTVNFNENGPITSLLLQRALSLSFIDLTPNVAICGSGGNATLCSFVGDVSGNFSANNNPPVPEPATMALVGLGLLGAGFARRRKQ